MSKTSHCRSLSVATFAVSVELKQVAESVIAWHTTSLLVASATAESGLSWLCNYQHHDSYDHATGELLVGMSLSASRSSKEQPNSRRVAVVAWLFATSMSMLFGGPVEWPVS